jgi:hypothetical protein
MKDISKNITLALIASYLSTKNIKAMKFSEPVLHMIEGIVVLAETEGIEIDKFYPEVLEYRRKFKDWREQRIISIADSIHLISENIGEYPLEADRETVRELRNLVNRLSRAIH